MVLVGRERVVGRKHRIQIAENVPFDLRAEPRPNQAHRPHGVLKTFPLFRARIGHDPQDAVLSAFFRPRREIIDHQGIVRKRDFLAETPLELLGQPGRVGDFIDR